MVRPTVATVRQSALRHNVAAIRRLLGADGPRLIAVVKANAYGHGLAAAAAIADAGADLLACADIEEGVALRRAGIRTPILVFGALSVSDLDGLFEFGLTPTVSTPAAAVALETAAARRGQVLDCHLKIDTGMNRLGFRHDNLRRTMPAVLANPHLRIVAVYSHAATADDPESPAFDAQRAAFERAMAALGALGVRGVTRHFANSAALIRDSRAWYDAVRPGLLLYGVAPPPLHAGDLDLRPALSLTSRIVAVKGMRAGEAVGYGRRWSPDTPRTVAVVPAGYADGLDTRLANRASALVGGRRVPIVGSVCMDMVTLDVTGVPAAPGDDVVFIGRQGHDEITARELAATAGTIPWDVLCRLGSRIERRDESE